MSGYFFFLQKMKDFSGNREGSSAVRRFLGKTMWIISISRNSIVVIIAMVLAYVLQNNGYEPFMLTGIKFIRFKNIIFIYPLVRQLWICYYESNICKRSWYSGLAWRHFETSTALAKAMGISLPPFQYDFLILKVKWSCNRPSVAQRVGRGIALLFHGCGTRRGWVVSSTPRLHFTPGKDPVPIVQEAGWAPGPVWLGGKSRPHWDSIPDHPAHNQSLYRLSYPTHWFFNITALKSAASSALLVSISMSLLFNETIQEFLIFQYDLIQVRLKMGFHHLDYLHSVQFHVMKLSTSRIWQANIALHCWAFLCYQSWRLFP